MIKRLSRVILLTMVLFASEASGQEDLLSDIEALLDTVRTAEWVQTSWERLGDREESTAARCIWAGQDNMRLDVFAGRGSGATAILYENRVYGFRRGLFSFLKRSYEPGHSRVRSLRGNSLLQNGFMDDLEQVLASEKPVEIDVRSLDSVTIRYEDSDGLQTTLQIRRDPIRVLIHERSDRDGLVERYTYSDVRYNPLVDGSLLEP